MSLWAWEFSMRVHVCNFKIYTLTKMLINQWSMKSLSSTPYGSYDLQQHRIFRSLIATFTKQR